MLTKLKHFSLYKTLLVCALSSLLLDILSSLYFVEYWKAQELSDRFVTLALFSQGNSIKEFDPHFLDEIKRMIENTGGFMLMIFLFINSLFYFYLVFKKKWAWQYVVTYTSTAALFCLITALESPKVGTFYSIYNITAIFLYALLSYVLWLRKMEVSEKGFRLKNVEQ